MNLPPPVVGKEQDPTKPTAKGRAIADTRNDGKSESISGLPLPQPATPGMQPRNMLTLNQLERDRYQQTGRRPPDKTKPSPADTAASEKPEPVVGPKTTGPGTATVGGARDPNVAAQGAPVDAHRAAPPPGYTKSVQEFSKSVAEPEKKEQK